MLIALLCMLSTNLNHFHQLNQSPNRFVIVVDSPNPPLDGLDWTRIYSVR
jgi:hypothetical protein